MTKNGRRLAKQFEYFFETYFVKNGSDVTIAWISVCI